MKHFRGRNTLAGQKSQPGSFKPCWPWKMPAAFMNVHWADRAWHEVSCSRCSIDSTFCAETLKAPKTSKAGRSCFEPVCLACEESDVYADRTNGLLYCTLHTGYQQEGITEGSQGPRWQAGGIMPQWLVHKRRWVDMRFLLTPGDKCN